MSAGWWRKPGDGAWKKKKGITRTSFYPNRFKCNPGLTRGRGEVAVKKRDWKPSSKPQGKVMVKSFYITSSLLGPRCPSSIYVQMPVEFPAHSPLSRGVYVRLSLNPDLETKAPEIETLTLVGGQALLPKLTFH